MFNNYDNNENNNPNEFSYYPDNQPSSSKSSGKLVMGFMLAIMTIIALSTIAVVALTITSAKNRQTSVGGGDELSLKADSSLTDTNEENAVVRTDIPTILQLSTPEDALSIPEIVEKVSPSVVGISCVVSGYPCTGTGIVMSADGYVLTNAHVVEGGTDIKVVLSKELDSQQLDAELIGADTQTDIAVLKVEKDNLPAAEFGTSAELVVGEAAIVIGNPLGFELSGSVTAGIISALDRELMIEDRKMNLVQTDASINSGNSGGPLINAYGQVIGITSAKINSTYGEGLGFAIPIDDAMPIVQDLLKYGYVKGRPQLGITGENISEIYSQYYGIPQGFIVRGVNEGSAAEKAGIKVDDIVIGINGNLITSIEEFNDYKAQYKAGDKISVSLYRNGEIVDVDVILGEANG